MKTKILTAFLLLLAWLPGFSQPHSLTCEYLTNPLGIDVLKPRLSWVLPLPDHNGNGIVSGPKRNFEVLGPLDFIAEFTQHIPPKDSHLIRYCGFYSNKARGMRKKAEVAQQEDASSPSDVSRTPARRCSQTWAMLIKRVYEVDPLVCSKCGGIMKVVSFIEPGRPKSSRRSSSIVAYGRNQPHEHHRI